MDENIFLIKKRKKNFKKKKEKNVLPLNYTSNIILNQGFSILSQNACIVSYNMLMDVGEK